MRTLVVVLLLAVAPEFGQVATLTLSPGVGTTNLVFSYNSANFADGIAEMQWTLTHQKDFLVSVAAGQAAKDAGKELLCSPVADGTKCLLIGKAGKRRENHQRWGGGRGIGRIFQNCNRPYQNPWNYGSGEKYPCCRRYLADTPAMVVLAARRATKMTRRRKLRLRPPLSKVNIIII